MKNFRLIIVVFFLLSISVCSAQKEFDNSQKKNLSSNKLYEKAKGFRGKSFDSTVFYLKESIKALKIEPNDSLSMKVNYALGATYKINNSPDSAITYFLKSKPFALKLKNIDFLYFSVNETGIQYGVKGDYDDSIDYFKKALEYLNWSEKEDFKASREFNVNYNKGTVYLNIGTTYYHLKKNKIALSFLKSGQILFEKEVKEKRSSINNLVNTYYMLTYINNELGNFNVSKEILKKYEFLIIDNKEFTYDFHLLKGETFLRK